MIANPPDVLKESGAIEVRKKLGTLSGGDVLDVGTEDGDFIKLLMKTLKEYTSFTGVDISEKELDKARERFKEDPVEFIVMNAESLTFQDNQFDMVCLSYTIHHLENIDSVLAEAYRVLKPGGYFIIQEMYSDGEQSDAQHVDLAVHTFDAKVDSLLGIPHFEALTRQRLRDYVDKIGLSDVEVFESSWSVNCLFCNDAHECVNPKRADNIDYVLSQIDDSLNRMGNTSNKELEKEAESLKERVKSDGSAAASVMYFFGRK